MSTETHTSIPVGSLLENIPTWSRPDDGSGYEPTQIVPAVTRRSVLRTMVFVGGTLALSGLDWISTRRRAWAHESTEWTEEDNSCGGYGVIPQYTRACWGARFSSRYCDEHKWFANITRNECRSQWLIILCGEGNPGYGARNAWRWTISGDVYRCSDGTEQRCGSSPQLRICSPIL